MKRNQYNGAAWLRTLIVCAVALMASLAFAGSPKLSKDLEGKKASDQVDVIVQYTQAPTARHHQKVLSRGGTLKQELSVVKAGAYSMPASALASLAADPEVAYISPDRSLSGYLNNGGPAVNAPYAWSLGLDGSNMAVAVIDSGIQATTSKGKQIPDLKLPNTSTSRIVYSQSWVNDAAGTQDAYGHGTNVAGIIGGNGSSSTGPQYTKAFKGIAPNVNLVNLRVLDANGMGTDSSVTVSYTHLTLPTTERV